MHIFSFSVNMCIYIITEYWPENSFKPLLTVWKKNKYLRNVFWTTLFRHAHSQSDWLKQILKYVDRNFNSLHVSFSRFIQLWELHSELIQMQSSGGILQKRLWHRCFWILWNFREEVFHKTFLVAAPVKIRKLK